MLKLPSKYKKKKVVAKLFWKNVNLLTIILTINERIEE